MRSFLAPKPYDERVAFVSLSDYDRAAFRGAILSARNFSWAAFWEGSGGSFFGRPVNRGSGGSSNFSGGHPFSIRPTDRPRSGPIARRSASRGSPQVHGDLRRYAQDRGPWESVSHFREEHSAGRAHPALRVAPNAVLRYRPRLDDYHPVPIAALIFGFPIAALILGCGSPNLVSA